ncbi:1-phosphofructokinase family hexose kinase [Methylocystis echinoides]|uniref:Phosphofructokinase n=1 Tax=Methylocystis echinoides TaxID=29468 RepID=A0A9W6GY73_9HYPH|nr:1-phosphofructokinase family hexose kinase [Methylocystis echinoides]GLI95144.1 phosphofructokinase [Methylocystis echinoides]
MTDVVTLCMNPSIDLSTRVDRVKPIRKLRCEALKRDPGGGGINVARVVRRLGADVTAIYPVGGSTGQLLRRLVAEEGVASLAFIGSEETRADFTVSEKETGDQFRFVLPGPQLSEQEWRQCFDAVISHMGPLLVASGSLPPGVPEDFYGRVARAAKQAGTRFIVDSSRASLEAALTEGVYLIKPNLRELEELARAPLENEQAWVEASRMLVEEGRSELVALTLGDQGALLVSKDRAWRAQGTPVEAVSAVGAGDSFLGGLVWSLASRQCLEDAFRYGNAAGTAAVLAAGTELCRKQDVERIYREVVVRKIWERF